MSVQMTAVRSAREQYTASLAAAGLDAPWMEPGPLIKPKASAMQARAISVATPRAVNRAGRAYTSSGVATASGRTRNPQNPTSSPVSRSCASHNPTPRRWNSSWLARIWAALQSGGRILPSIM